MSPSFDAEPDLVCKDDLRRDEVRRSPYVNGLDYLEFTDQPLERGKPVRMWVYFLDKAPETLRIENIRITGGRRITGLKVIDLHFCRQDDPDQDDCLIVTLDRPGDLSTYTLCIVEVDEDGRPTGRLHPGFDPHYACLHFSFQDVCPSDLDCKTGPACPPEPLQEPEIDYLAKDYASFRRLILDRLAVVMPDWKERHVPDLGITLVELLAYTGDYLSYYQDAAATEAYLDTARQRISVRRHARLVDYRMHEGCNARAWVCFQTNQDVDLDPQDFYLTTGLEENKAEDSRIFSEDELRKLLASQSTPPRYEVFEPLFEGEEPLRFTPASFKAAGCLALRLGRAGDPLSRYLLKELPQDLRQVLEGLDPDPPGYPYLPAAWEEELAAALNRFIEGPNLHTGPRFAGVELRPETQALLDENPSGEALVRLNRMLLEDAYPVELARHRLAGETIRLYAAHSRMRFYTWGDLECCLPAGSTRATLLDEWESQEPPPGQDPNQGGPYVYAQKPAARAAPYQKAPPKGAPAGAPKGNPRGTPHQGPPKEPPPKGTPALEGDCARLRKLRHLRPGDVLILEEVTGPETGSPADADPNHRHAVRLVRVEFTIDRLYGTPVVEIEWAPADALPFPLCISATSQAPDCEPLHDVSVACGNVILVDHGRRVDEPLGCVPVVETLQPCEEDCLPSEIQRLPGRYRPVLADYSIQGGITFSQPVSAALGAAAGLPASALLAQDPRRALPWITLDSQLDPGCLAEPAPSPDAPPAPVIPWVPRPDLLSSGRWDAHFVVEVDNERRAHLRFGDGELGRPPEGGSSFQARYRVGSGRRGNVGANTIVHLVLRSSLLSGVVLSVCNPLPAQGGLDPEPLEEVKLFAPHAFRLDLARAITAEDYAAIVMRDFSDRVQRAAAALRWKGSGYEVLVAVDGFALAGQTQAGPALLDEIAAHLEAYRRIGHDVIVSPAQYVPLEISLEVCVLPNYLRGHVKAALLDLLSNRRLPDGRLGFFHPDQLSFGTGLPLSRLVAAVQAVEGVESVSVGEFKRLFEAPNHERENGILPLGPLEVARLDNDPNFPENGKLTITLRGGR